MDDVRFSEITYGSPLLGLAPALCLAAVVALAVRRHREGCRPSTLAWLVPYALLLAASCAWYAAGVGAPSLVPLLALCGACMVASGVSLARDSLELPTVGLLVGTAVCGVLALELTWNEKAQTIGPQFWLAELTLVAGFLAALWLLCGRRGVGCAVGVLALTAVGVAQHYVLQFRGTSILPSDIFALNTAMSVSGGYTYGLSDSMLWGFSALALGLACASLLRSPEHVTMRERLRDVGISVGVAAITVALAVVPSYRDVLGANLDYWWSKDWYERQGFLPSFAYALQDLRVPVPQGYGEQAASDAQRSLAARYEGQAGVSERREASAQQFADARPNLIVIQNETFCDLSNFDGLANGYAGPAFWNDGIGPVLARGDFAVSVFGGGTCNTEFEFLTGNSLAFLGTSKYPFTMYDLNRTSSLPRQLGELGYHTVGLHPNVASNWNRDRAYAELGFDEFLSIDDFAGAEEFHTHVSDWATYERVLDLVAQSDDPVFAFDVTMQNHSGYDTGSVPQSMLPGYEIDGLGADDTFQLNEYLACIEESDHAFQRLIETLGTVGEPTVVVMYGDHHPWFSQAVNDLLFPDEDELVHGERIHNTTYAMWANYEVAGWEAKSKEEATDDTSADLLPSMMLDVVGAPLTDFQKAQLGARTFARALNADGYLGADEAWHHLDESLHELELVEYQNISTLL